MFHSHIVKVKEKFTIWGNSSTLFLISESLSLAWSILFVRLSIYLLNLNWNIKILISSFILFSSFFSMNIWSGISSMWFSLDSNFMYSVTITRNTYWVFNIVLRQWNLHRLLSCKDLFYFQKVLILSNDRHILIIFL